MGYTPVGYFGEYGSLDGRQTVLRAELTAAMRTLAVKHYGHRANKVTVWSDSKIVVDGYRKSKSTLQSALVTDWQELWERVEALNRH
eukprot:7796424-Karenia_brevis.AAC.1